LQDKYGNALRVGYNVVPDVATRGVGKIVALVNDQVLVKWEESGDEELWMPQNLILKDVVHSGRRRRS
jgi:hypothetical protein